MPVRKLRLLDVAFMVVIGICALISTHIGGLNELCLVVVAIPLLWAQPRRDSIIPAIAIVIVSTLCLALFWIASIGNYGLSSVELSSTESVLLDDTSSSCWIIVLLH